MTRPYYSEYVRHALRFYTRNLHLTHFNSEIDKANWWACASVLKSYPEEDRKVFIAVYSGRDTLADNVYMASTQYGVDLYLVWDKMKELERKIAKKRELI